MASLLVKIQRAGKNVEDLQAACDAFFDSHPYVIESKDDLHTRERSYYLVSMKGVPDEIAAICGDVLYNLRSALDHLAYHLVASATGKPPAHTSISLSPTVLRNMHPPTLDEK
jgi:hypothetical protein